jgi:hypothetical protein
VAKKKLLDEASDEQTYAPKIGSRTLYSGKTPFQSPEHMVHEKHSVKILGCTTLIQRDRRLRQLMPVEGALNPINCA